MPQDGTRLVTAQLDFSSGVNSNVVPIRTTDGIPHGLSDSSLAWSNNAVVRGGGISPRFGWVPVVQGAGWSGLFQGGAFYTPDYGEPQLILAIGGKIYRVRTDTNFSVQNLSAVFALSRDTSRDQYFFAQGEKWLIIQDGTLINRPLFLSTNDDGSTPAMVESRGFVGVNNPQNQIPPGMAMDYYQQRLWYSFGRFYAGGDIVFNKVSGTAPFQYRDSVLAVTENPVPSGGDAFVTPISSGNIRWLRHAANLNTQLGETNLFIGTRNAVFACNAPITRDDWTKATLDLMPLQTVALVGAGAYSERGATPINQDILFASTPNGDVRSLQTAIKNFQQPGQIPISNNINRVLNFNNRALLHLTSSVYHDTRFLQTVLPYTTPVGVAFQGIASLDFNPLSSFQETLPPVWDGVWEGLAVLQLFQANIGGRDRCFAAVVGESGGIDIWELTTTEKFNVNASGVARTEWSFETASFAWGDATRLKELETLRMWLDRIVGTVEIRVEFRVDQTGCWLPWKSFKICAAKDCTELVDSPCASNGYPSPAAFCEGFESDLSLPKPPQQCVPFSNRPANIGYVFQFRITLKGWARVRGLYAFALPRVQPPFVSMVC